MNVLLFTILTLCALGVLAAVILYFVAQKFKVFEDPRIDEVEVVLPGANCGGCGFPGCRGFADALVAADDISTLYCPVGGMAVMKPIAEILGKAAAEKEAEIAVVRCNGSCANRPRTNEYDGASSCAVIASLYAGETACAYGCFGKGDCVSVCNFDAIFIDPQTGLPVVDEEKCTACGACTKACPRLIIELRKKGPKGRRVYVSCVNKDKGGVARKACQAACIGCGKCVKTCPFEAITLENNLAYIDYTKCKLCRKCPPECPTGAIWEVNFPARPPKKEEAKPTGPKADKPAAKKEAVTTKETNEVVGSGEKKAVAGTEKASVAGPSEKTAPGNSAANRDESGEPAPVPTATAEEAAAQEAASPSTEEQAAGQPVRVTVPIAGTDHEAVPTPVKNNETGTSVSNPEV